MKRNIISNIACFHFHFNILIEQKNKDQRLAYLLELPKTNYILCLSTTDTSEPAADVRRTSRGYAPLFGIHEHKRPVIAWSSRLRNQRRTFSNRRCFYK